MKILDKINQESKIYLIGITFSVIAVFVLSAVIFMFLIADKLDIVMTQNAKITYTYFISVMNRILAIITIFLVIPLTTYQLKSTVKSKFDKITKIITVIILLLFCFTFFIGEYNYFYTYKNGDLDNSVMFSKPTFETKIFDKIK